MSLAAEDGWRLLRGVFVNLKPTLSGGQSFRWRHDEERDEWTGIFRGTVWKLRQKDGDLGYRVVASLHEDGGGGGHFEAALRKYLRLDADLDALYKKWSGKDEWFASVADKFRGIRMLAQEPVENVFSFICSSNNNISRISSMIEQLCVHYGEKIFEEDGISYYSFPTINKLCTDKLESHLRELKFGYRSKFIHQSALKINEWGDGEWFDSLAAMPYEDAKRELLKLPGVGPKVADCICLMSLNHLEAIPVDTHVYQIASSNYLPHLRSVKSVTDKVYKEIGDHFRDLYEIHAGWAHTVLFCADLKKFEEPGSKRISNLSHKEIKKKIKKK